MSSCNPPIPAPAGCDCKPAPKPSGCGCKPATQPPQAIDRPHDICDCLAKEPEIIDLISPLYHACGGRLYRLLLATKAAAVFMGDGTSAELRINQLERAIAQNTTLRFADDLAGRDSQKGLIPGDVCVVFDATADPTVHEGGATYMWLPSLQWKKMYNMDTPADPANFIKWKGGLAVDGDRLVYVDCPAIIEKGGGLAVNPDGDMYVRIQDLIKPGGGLGADENGDFYVKLEDLIKPGGGLATDGNGHMYVRVDNLIATGSGLVITEDGKINFDAGQMSQAPLLALLKTLHLPQWLDGDKDIWVDGSSGNDALTDGRGNRETPFRTIQAAVNYACENFNVGDHVLTIHVVGGGYDEAVTLKDFTRSGGRMKLVGEGSVSIASHVSGAAALDVIGGKWTLRNVAARCRIHDNILHRAVCAAISASSGNADLTLEYVSVQVSQEYAGGSGGVFGIGGVNYAKISIGNGCSITASCTAGESRIKAINADKSAITLDHTGSLPINGPYMVVAAAISGGSITRNWVRMGRISGNATGSRFEVSTAGVIDTISGGDQYFPGSSAGAADASTYGIYK